MSVQFFPSVLLAVHDTLLRINLSLIFSPVSDPSPHSKRFNKRVVEVFSVGFRGFLVFLTRVEDIHPLPVIPSTWIIVIEFFTVDGTPPATIHVHEMFGVRKTFSNVKRTGQTVET